MNPERERALIDDSARGDERAFADLVRMMAPELIRALTRIVRNGDLAEELAQLAFLRAWRNLALLRDPASFRRWLWRIARCAAYDQLRRRLGSSGPPERLEEILPEQLPSGAPSAERELMRRELALEARRQLDGLSRDSRDILILRYEQGLGYGEIAERLGLTQTQVKARLARSRGALRSRLEGALDEWRRLDV